MSPNLKIFPRIVFLFLVFLIFDRPVTAQNYTSIGSGSWTTASNWNNTSGWGDPTPASGQSSGTTNVNHNLTYNGNYSAGSATINVNTGITMTVNGGFTIGGGGTVNVYGTLDISGSAVLNSNLRIYPGGKVIIDGNLTVVSSNNLTVGTNVAPPAYADLVVKGNLISQTSGDVTIERNGRVVIYGDVTAAGGGTLFRVNNGGQVYIDGDISFTGGGSDIINNNTTSPYGLYVNGTVVNSGGGSTVTTNRGNKNDLINTNPSFFNWIAAQEDSPLPVELLFFEANNNNGFVELKWATASQLDFDYFAVEHSTDAQVWEELKQIKGQGTTNNRTDYKLSDVKSLVGANYYRLKMVDLDGTFEYSIVDYVNMEETKQMSLYPNPINQAETLTFDLNFTPNDGDKIFIYNHLGVELLSFTASASSIAVALDDLKPGTYLVKYVSVNSSIISRLMVE
ncbi:MAG: T9SS C-terminal target domain-containing protein [Cytophagia bacterium]|nr:T9SS C-terminal target domain-containing protein [Cytophagia bacterium]